MASKSHSAPAQKAKPPSVTERLNRIENKLGIDVDRKDQQLRNGLIIAATTIVSGAVIGWATYITLGVISLKQAAKSAGVELIAELKKPSSSAQLQANLSTVVAQVQTARAANVKLNPKKIVPLSNAVSQVIRDSPNIAEGWQAASVLISYQSQPQVNRSDCNSGFSVGNASRVGNGHVHIDNLLIHDCTLTLDDTAQFVVILKRLINVPNGVYDVSKLHLTRVHVIYRGGPVSQIGSIFFTDCTFDFQEHMSPAVRGQKVTEQLLASANQSNVSVDLQGASDL